jgi:hypothetical protein
MKRKRITPAEVRQAQRFQRDLRPPRPATGDQKPGSSAGRPKRARESPFLRQSAPLTPTRRRREQHREQGERDGEALVWLTDDAIPNYGTTSFTQIIVSAPAVAMVFCEGEGVVSVFPETKATELDVLVNSRKYVAAITRHAAGTATIQGAAYAAAEK